MQQLSSTVTKSVVQVLTTGFGLTTDERRTDTAYLEAQRGIGAGVDAVAGRTTSSPTRTWSRARDRIRVRLQGLDKQTPTRAGGSRTAPSRPSWWASIA